MVWFFKLAGCNAARSEAVKNGEALTDSVLLDYSGERTEARN